MFKNIETNKILVNSLYNEFNDHYLKFALVVFVFICILSGENFKNLKCFFYFIFNLLLNALLVFII